MRLIKLFIAGAYWTALALLAAFAVLLGVWGESGTQVFHKISFYLPSIAAIFVVSLQIDYLQSIWGGKEVNIRARMIDFVHWLMLVSINASTWLSGQITIWWLLIQLVVLAVIGCSIGLGFARKKLVLTTAETWSAILAGSVALGIGILMAALRSTQILSIVPDWLHATIISMIVLGFVWHYVSSGLKDEELGIWKYLGFPTVLGLGLAIGAIGHLKQFDTGWWLDTLSGIVAIVLVSGFIIHDLTVIRKDHRGYQRPLFLKGIFGCNVLILVSWLHTLLAASEYEYQRWILKNLGFSFVTIVGNLIYAYYYLSYEYHRHQQERKQPIWIP